MEKHGSGLSIGIVGAGAIGGFLAARLGAAGAPITALARGATLAALRQHGLYLSSGLGDVHLPSLRVSDDAGALGQPDIVIVAVKSQDTAAAAAAMAPMVGPHTWILSVQNGLTGGRVLTERFGTDRLALGVTWVPATVEAPGRIRHTGPVRRVVFGPASPGAASDSLAALAELGHRGGLEMELRPDPRPAIWEKLVVLAPFHGISALTRLPLGHWLSVPETRALYANGMAEAAAVGRAEGVALPEDIVTRSLTFSEEVADPATRASMLDDIEAGRALELDASLGELVERGARAGVPTPTLGLLRALLLPRRGGDPTGKRP